MTPTSLDNFLHTFTAKEIRSIRHALNTTLPPNFPVYNPAALPQLNLAAYPPKQPIPPTPTAPANKTLDQLTRSLNFAYGRKNFNHNAKPPRDPRSAPKITLDFPSNDYINLTNSDIHNALHAAANATATPMPVPALFPQVNWRGMRTNGADFWYNYNEIASNPTPRPTATPHPCRCHEFPPWSLKQGHVQSADPRVIASGPFAANPHAKALALCMRYGSTQRSTPNLSVPQQHQLMIHNVIRYLKSLHYAPTNLPYPDSYGPPPREATPKRPL